MHLGAPTIIATGFRWAEGPLWVDRLGSLLVSDVKANTIWRLHPSEDSSEWTRDVYLRPSGTSDPHPPGEEHGSNGLALDAEERVAMCSHGERGVFVVDEDRWTKRPILTHVQGHRINSPNDLARHPTSGALYVTDPPYGLAGWFDDPRREVPFCAIYRFCPDTGAVTIATDALPAPNGIAFSPDGRTAYATNSSPPEGRFVAFDVRDDGTFGAPRTLLALPGATYETGMPDGLAVASDGTLFGAGPDGLYVFDADGSHREIVEVEPLASNIAIGQGGTALFATAKSCVHRFPLET
ncbi:MAG: SMP-30/gluconolactonase/LRE family protein [Bacteroidota bacterium]